MAKKLTMELVTRHIRARVNTLESQSSSDHADYHDCVSRKEEMEKLLAWIEERDIWKPARERDHKATCRRLGWTIGRTE